MSFSTFNTIHVRNKSSKYCKKSSNSNNFSDCDIDKLIQAVTDKIPSSVLKDRLILEYYERLYNEAFYQLNQIINVFKSSTTGEISKLYNTETFLSLSIKITSIKIDLIANFCDPDNLPYHVNNFINYYIEHAFILLCELRFIIQHVNLFNERTKCCEILSSLEKIKEYVKNKYGKDLFQQSNASAAITVSAPIQLSEPYQTYMNKHGFPEDGCFDPELLAIISIELGLNNN